MKPLAFIPGKKFPSVSITGNKCWLMCSYCRGRYLNAMVHITSPCELYDFAEKLVENSGIGMLISGGFTREGKLPIKPYLNTIKRIKNKYSLILSIHPGLVSYEEARELGRAGFDIADYELVLDEQVIRVLKHLDKSPRDYIVSLEALLQSGIPHVVPHIPIGFTHSDEWVYKAVDLLTSYDLELVVFLVSMSSRPEITKRVVDILRYARKKLDTEISLGCMRPYRVKEYLDPVVIEEELVDRIVNPLKKHIKKYKLEIVEACCSIPRDYVVKLLKTNT
ncbi:MAG: radical SAM protein [Thermoprotei archaeon]